MDVYASSPIRASDRSWDRGTVEKVKPPNPERPLDFSAAIPPSCQVSRHRRTQADRTRRSRAITLTRSRQRTAPQPSVVTAHVVAALRVRTRPVAHTA